MADNPYPPGMPCWVVVATPDAVTTAAFYSRLFGWNATEGSAGFTTPDGRDAAGLLQLPEAAREAGAPSRWLVYLATADINAALKKVGPAGGSILAPAFDVPGAGRMAVVTDATGAELGLWEAWGHPGVGAAGEPGALVWTELYTRSRAAASSFYSAVFDWVVEEVQAGQASFITCSLDGRPVAGMMQMSAAWGETPSHWMPYFGVADADEAASLAAGFGGEVRADPRDTGGGRIAVLRDPLGALFFVVAEERK